MNKNDKTSRLEEFAFLWESGEWTLHVTYHSRLRVVFVFPTGRPSVAELSAIRALVPRFTNAPVTELKREVGELHEFVLGEFPNLEARKLLAGATARGLKTRTEDTSFTSYFPAANGTCLLIDDQELAQRVVEKMRLRGVPIVHAESD